MSEPYLVKCNGYYYVGSCLGDWIMAKRSYFAWRFATAAEARELVRNNLTRTGKTIDVWVVSRLKLRDPK